MRRLFLLLLVALLAGVGVVAMIETEPGYVLVSYGNYTLETSVWVGSVLMLLFVFIIYFGFGVLGRLLRSPSSMSGWLDNRRSHRDARLTNRGLINFIEGNWSKARSQLLRGARHNEAPLLNYLVAARASYQLGEPDKMRDYLGEADASESGAGIAVDLTQAEIQLGAGHYEQAVATLVRARRNAGRHPYVLSLLLSAYRNLSDWDNLATVLPDCRKYKVIQDDELNALEGEVYRNRLSRIAAAGEGPQAVAALHKEWQQVPGRLRRDADTMTDYLKLLLACGDNAGAEKMALRFLKAGWNSDLVRVYGLVESSDPGKQLKQAQKWLPEHSQDTELLLSLGRLATRDKQFDRAREYFESCHKISPSIEVCAELGLLLENMGEDVASAAFYREGLQMTAPGLPHLLMSTGVAQKR